MLWSSAIGDASDVRSRRDSDRATFIWAFHVTGKDLTIPNQFRLEVSQNRALKPFGRWHMPSLSQSIFQSRVFRQRATREKERGKILLLKCKTFIMKPLLHPPPPSACPVFPFTRRSGWRPPSFTHMAHSMDNIASGISAPLLGPTSTHLPDLHHNHDHYYQRHRKKRPTAERVEYSRGKSGNDDDDNGAGIAEILLGADSPERDGGNRNTFPVAEGDIAAGQTGRSAVIRGGPGNDNDYDVGHYPVGGDHEEEEGRGGGDIHSQDVFAGRYDDDDGGYYGARAERERSRTFEFGTGNSSNPALLAVPKSRQSYAGQEEGNWGARREGGGKKRGRRWGKGQESPSDTGNGIVAPDGVLRSGVGVGSVTGGAGSSAVGTRRSKGGDKLDSWFDSPHSPQEHDAQSEISALSDHQQHPDRQQSQQRRQQGRGEQERSDRYHRDHNAGINGGISAATSTPTAAATTSSLNRRNGPADPKGDQNVYPWSSEGGVGDGYVSLTSRFDSDIIPRRSTGDELLLEGGVGGDDAGGGGGSRNSWLCSNGGLVMFREQLYEEGRSKGKKGNLAAR